MRTATSPVGSYQHEDGFTLLELLVVLAVIAFATTLIPGFLLRDHSATGLDRVARAVADGLREARSRAVLANRDELFAIDVASHQFRAGEAATPVQLDRAIGLELVTARSEQVAAMAGRIRFFPDGSSTGGRIVLLNEGDSRSIEVDWLTGDVMIAHDPP